MTIIPSSLMDELSTGVPLCKLAQLIDVREQANRDADLHEVLPRRTQYAPGDEYRNVEDPAALEKFIEERPFGNTRYAPTAQPDSMDAENNIGDFLDWCNNALDLRDPFSVDDLLSTSAQPQACAPPTRKIKMNE